MNDADFERLWMSLVDRKYKKTGAPLTENEKLLFALNLFAGGVPRSGMIGYFQNSTGNEIVHAKTALNALGMIFHRKILEDAEHILMNGKPIPLTDDQIEVISRDLSEEEYEAQSKRIEAEIAPVEERFAAIEDDLYDAIDRFIEMNGIEAPG